MKSSQSHTLSPGYMKMPENLTTTYLASTAEVISQNIATLHSRCSILKDCFQNRRISPVNENEISQKITLDADKGSD